MINAYFGLADVSHSLGGIRRTGVSVQVLAIKQTWHHSVSHQDTLFMAPAHFGFGKTGIAERSSLVSSKGSYRSLTGSVLWDTTPCSPVKIS
jgi:hypothetical protein